MKEGKVQRRNEMDLSFAADRHHTSAKTALHVRMKICTFDSWLNCPFKRT